MPGVRTTLLAITALVSAATALTLWLRVGADAAPPIILLALIALTCILRIITVRR